MELRAGRGNDRRLHKREKLLAEVEPIFTLIAYRRVAKFQDNQTKRTDNSHEDRGHKSRSSGREFTITRTKLGNRTKEKTCWTVFLGMNSRFRNGGGARWEVGGLQNRY